MPPFELEGIEQPDTSTEYDEESLDDFNNMQDYDEDWEWLWQLGANDNKKPHETNYGIECGTAKNKRKTNDHLLMQLQSR